VNILNSWKEIANYLGRGVRTVQRWERDLGLPVHRPKGKDRSAVLAFPEELDQWLQQTPVRSAEMFAGRHQALTTSLCETLNKITRRTARTTAA
jgi:transposase